MPEWRHHAFDKLFSSLSNALNEEQIREVSDFHRWLDKLTDAHARIRKQFRDYGQGRNDVVTGSSDEWQIFED